MMYLQDRYKERRKVLRIINIFLSYLLRIPAVWRCSLYLSIGIYHILFHVITSRYMLGWQFRLSVIISMREYVHVSNELF